VSGASDPEGTRLEFLWRLDGLLLFDWSVNATVVHTFDGPGTYIINVTARDAGGLVTGTSLALVVVEDGSEPEPPMPNDPDGPSVFLTGLIAVVVIALVGLVAVLYLRQRGEI
jgi:hypothetical protein